MFMAKQPRTERRRFVPAVQAGQSLSRHPAPLTQQTVTRPAIVPPQVEIASEPAVPVHALSSAPIQAKLGKARRSARRGRPERPTSRRLKTQRPARAPLSAICTRRICRN